MPRPKGHSPQLPPSFIDEVEAGVEQERILDEGRGHSLYLRVLEESGYFKKLQIHDKDEAVEVEAVDDKKE